MHAERELRVIHLCKSLLVNNLADFVRLSVLGTKPLRATVCARRFQFRGGSGTQRGLGYTSSAYRGAMPFQLDLRHESLTYKGQYSRPPLELWGKGASIIAWFLESLAPYGVTLQHIKFAGQQATLTDWVVLAEVSNFGSVKFSFDKLEFNFINFSQAFFESVPQMMDRLVDGLGRIVENFEFSSHGFVYFCHAFIKDGTVQDAMKALSPPELKGAGISLGNGAIFNHTLPSKSWETQLIIDRSHLVAGGLFISLDVKISSGNINYSQVVMDARQYLGELLQELNLALPEAQG
jgi:hypothetical protein